jgi:predicted secreted protein
MMKSVCTTSFALLILALAGAVRSAGIMEVGMESDGKTVQAMMGHTFKVNLPIQAGTGYEWVLTTQPQYLQAVGTPQTHQPDKSIPGGKETTVFTFLANSVGSDKLHFELIRSFDKPPKPAKEFNVTIEVTSS